MAKSDFPRPDLVPPPRAELDFYEEMTNGDWRECKAQWLAAANGFLKPDGRLMGIHTYRYLTDVYLSMGNGGKFHRGVYQFAAQRTAQRLGLGGRGEKRQKDIVSQARQEAIRYGFISELRRGSGGNGYTAKGSTVVMSFKFLDLQGEDSPVKSGADIHGKSGTDIHGKSTTLISYRANTGGVTGKQLVADGSATWSQEPVHAGVVPQSEWRDFPPMEPCPFDGVHGSVG